MAAAINDNAIKQMKARQAEQHELNALYPAAYAQALALAEKAAPTNEARAAAIAALSAMVATVKAENDAKVAADAAFVALEECQKQEGNAWLRILIDGTIAEYSRAKAELQKKQAARGVKSGCGNPDCGNPACGAGSMFEMLFGGSGSGVPLGTFTFPSSSGKRKTPEPAANKPAEPEKAEPADDDVPDLEEVFAAPMDARE